MCAALWLGDRADRARTAPRLLGRAALRARCLSGIRPLAGRHPDRGAGVRAATGRGAGHEAHRERGEWHRGTRDAALGVHSRVVGRDHHVCEERGCTRGAAGDRGTPRGARQHAAGRRRDAQAFPARLEHHGPAEDRPPVRQGRCLHAARCRGLGDQAAPPRRTGCCARHRLRRRSTADPDSSGHRQAGELQRHHQRGGGCGTHSAAAARRWLHRSRLPADPDQVADPSARRRRPRRGGRHRAQQHPHTAARSRRGEDGAGTALRRCADHGQARSAAVTGESIRGSRSTRSCTGPPISSSAPSGTCRSPWCSRPC